ncbi:MAG: mandelate racemase [Acidobacteriota bacterium]|nr:mandelate racemase [Acidobacteriota bacterium]
MAIDSVQWSAYRIPTDRPEADGTLTWDSTTLVAVSVRDGGVTGLGWTYAAAAAASLGAEELSPILLDADPATTPRLNEAMVRACRNLGRPGLAAAAISAADIALWDLRSRQLDLPLVDLFGRYRDDVPIYGSGGFTTYDDATTTEQLDKWVNEWDIPRVKIKIGESWGGQTKRDLARIDLARRVIGDAELYVDANGAYGRKQARRLAAEMVDRADVRWFEEPVSSDDLEGLADVRASSTLDVAAGEYGYTLGYFARMVGAGSVDCVQADVTRCGGFTVWRRVADVVDAHHLQISGHCAPNLHAHVAASVPNLRHVEYFHDHHRIETAFFEGALSPQGGALVPDRGRSGHGMSLDEASLAAHRVG